MSKNEPIQKKINVQTKTNSENKKCLYFLGQNKIPIKNTPKKKSLKNFEKKNYIKKLLKNKNI